ncbi:MAG: carbon-nitrogen hydrolase family protein [Pseudomonadota bacterium]
MRDDVRLRVACVQNSARADWQASTEHALMLAGQAVDDGAQLIAFPEYFSGVRTDGARVVPAAFAHADHPAREACAVFARARGVWLLLGSLGVESGDGRIFNRAYVLDPSGATVAIYDKLHLFDVDLADGKTYRESATIAPGDEAVIAPTPWGGLGLSICYDLRFPLLYRALAQAGARILAVPAAFTRTTGAAHWHTLVRARAIETGAFVIAPCQHGTLEGGAACYGHSLIVDPWGRVLADGGEDDGFVCADLDMAASDAAREAIPSLASDRSFEVVSIPAHAPSAAAE